MSQPANATLDHLARLAAKPGVRATLILSKSDGTIIRSTGLSISHKDTPEAEQGYQDGTGQTTAADVAEMAYNFVKASADFANGMLEGDDVQLLRLRTKKNEIVIVPDTKYLLVVIHDATKAG